MGGWFPHVDLNTQYIMTTISLITAIVAPLLGAFFYYRAVKISGWFWPFVFLFALCFTAAFRRGFIVVVGPSLDSETLFFIDWALSNLNVFLLMLSGFSWYFFMRRRLMW